eukprot:CAMPEP_0181429370 /NCGR_PEP_ID=MMETSP1110-20121109/17163_1 /TAXON_ID=174948 /ORGANISM="Symbiodinium sp., Strain CCMP421" /LENGTH=154 /DNA_ID=CAMNT_0023552633 /DNA_START=61 /DNA_END=527 /DNA_ORIENTATION=-
MKAWAAWLLFFPFLKLTAAAADGITSQGPRIRLSWEADLREENSFSRSGLATHAFSRLEPREPGPSAKVLQPVYFKFREHHGRTLPLPQESRRWAGAVRSCAADFAEEPKSVLPDLTTHLHALQHFSISAAFECDLQDGAFQQSARLRTALNKA